MHEKRQPEPEKDLRRQNDDPVDSGLPDCLEELIVAESAAEVVGADEPAVIRRQRLDHGKNERDRRGDKDKAENGQEQPQREALLPAALVPAGPDAGRDGEGPAGRRDGRGRPDRAARGPGRHRPATGWLGTRPAS